MGKTVFLFSGQGSQYPGMGADLCSGFEAARKIYRKASEVMGYDVAGLSRDASPETLAQTIISQPAIFTLSMAVYELLSDFGIVPDAVAGFSLGECSALTAAGAMSLETGLRVIKARAGAMQRASEEISSAMFAIIGAQQNDVEEACKRAEGTVAPVNYNCPGQIVIAGETGPAQAVAESLSKGRVRAVRLPVGAAFHSKLMAGASEAFYSEIKGFDFNPPAIPVYSNTTGDVVQITDVSEYLKNQIVNPVRFESEMAAFSRDGYDTFAELGPGRTLCGFIRKGVRGAQTYNIENCDTLSVFLKAVKKVRL